MGPEAPLPLGGPVAATAWSCNVAATPLHMHAKLVEGGGLLGGV